MNTQRKTSMKHTRILLLIALLAAAAVGSSRLDPATITIVNTNDNGTGSLRQALADAVDGDTINFNSSLNGETITLTSGELLVDKRVTISGPGANRLAVDANHTSRVFYIASGTDVTISGLTITNGSAPSHQFGGGIYNDHATLTLSSCTISGNAANQGGGAAPRAKNAKNAKKPSLSAPAHQLGNRQRPGLPDAYRHKIANNPPENEANFRNPQTLAVEGARDPIEAAWDARPAPQRVAKPEIPAEAFAPLAQDLLLAKQARLDREAKEAEAQAAAAAEAEAIEAAAAARAADEQEALELILQIAATL